MKSKVESTNRSGLLRSIVWGLGAGTDAGALKRIFLIPIHQSCQLD